MSDNNSNFPYKTLIWAILATIALFIFKPELKVLITGADHIIMFGIEIKTNKEQARLLTDSIHQFEIKIDNLSTQITSQQEKIRVLDRLKVKLESDLETCPSAKENIKQYSNQLNTVFQGNIALKAKSDNLKSIQILQTAKK